MTYKKRNIILLASVLILLYLSWNLAIGETVKLADQVSQIETDLKNLENAPNEIARLESELSQVKGKTDKLYSSVLDMRKSLLSEISDLANQYQLTLKSFPDYYLQQKEGIELTTSPIVLSGNFKGMVQLINEFENKNISGKISSTLFEIKESPRTKKRTLYLTLYVQSINL